MPICTGVYSHSLSINDLYGPHPQKRIRSPPSAAINREAGSFSISSGALKTSPPLILELSLAWSCPGLMQVTTAAVSWLKQQPRHVRSQHRAALLPICRPLCLFHLLFQNSQTLVVEVDTDNSLSTEHPGAFRLSFATSSPPTRPHLTIKPWGPQKISVADQELNCMQLAVRRCMSCIF